MLVEEARRSGIADVATGGLAQHFQYLNTVSTNTDLIYERVANRLLVKRLHMSNQLLEANKDQLPDFFANSDKAPLLLQYLAALEVALASDIDDIQAFSKAVLEATALISEIIDHQQTLALGSQYREFVSIDAVVEKVLNIKQNFILRSGVTVETELSGLPEIQCFKAKLFQVFVNLLVNSCQAVYNARETGGIICFSGRVENGFLKIAVEDNGSGVAAENQDKLFTYGFTTKSNGHGYGLHSCKGYLDEMNGNDNLSKSERLGVPAL